MGQRPIYWQELGKVFRALRDEKGWTVRQAGDIAKRKGLDLNYLKINRLENGRTKNPTPDVIRAMAKLYGKNYADLVSQIARLTAPERYGVKGVKQEGARPMDAPSQDSGHTGQLFDHQQDSVDSTDEVVKDSGTSFVEDCVEHVRLSAIRGGRARLSGGVLETEIAALRDVARDLKDAATASQEALVLARSLATTVLAAAGAHAAERAREQAAGDPSHAPNVPDVLSPTRRRHARHDQKGRK